jgi:hypothetical protein
MAPGLPAHHFFSTATEGVVMRVWALTVGAAFWAVSASSAHAQADLLDLRVRVQSAENAAAAGALVALIDSAGKVVTEGMTSEAGVRVLRARAGTYTVRVRRIGFFPFTSQRVSLPRADELVLIPSTSRVVLTTVVVTARTQCGQTEGSTMLSLVWDEITKALRASQLTAGDLPDGARAISYSAELDARGRVTKADTTVIPLRNHKPFRAPNPARLAQRGYVEGDEYTGWDYYGPDEAVLLSPEFLATHCFTAVRDRERPGQVGLAFEPVRGRRTADIEGFLWVDEATSELREMTFRYTNAGLMTRFSAGGSVQFRKVKSGAWLVYEWRLRAPRLARNSRLPAEVVRIGFSESGGGIVLSAAN